jgi:hypothetical protein
MTNKSNALPSQAIDFPMENRVHIAGVTGASVSEIFNDFKCRATGKRTAPWGKRTVKWCSSAVERPVHIGKAVGSTPTTTTVPLLEMLSKPGVAERFWAKVKTGLPHECWEWQGARRRKVKYSAATFKATSYTTVSAPRSAYTLAKGEDPGQLWVLHHCDNPTCCNPDHLYLGTAKENAADVKARNRRRNVPKPGETNPRAKLTADQVENVRALFRQGKTNTSIGQLLGVHHSTISKIRTGNSW